MSLADEDFSRSDFWSALRAVPSLRDGVVLRVSRGSLDDLQSQTELGRRLHANLPAMKLLEAMPIEEMLKYNEDGERARRENGMVTIRRRDVSRYADSPTSIMGYAVTLGDSSVALFIHDSAAEPNIRVPGDHLPRVAFTELLIEMMARFEALECLYFNEYKRMSRDQGAGQRLYDSARTFRVTLSLGDKGDLDLDSTSGEILASVERAVASEEVKTTSRRTTGGVLSALHSGSAESLRAWPYAADLMPLGYGPVLDANGFPIVRSGTKSSGKWKLIAPDAREVEAVREMLRLAAEGHTWEVCGKPLIDAAVRLRGTQRRAESTYADLAKVPKDATDEQRAERAKWANATLVRSVRGQLANLDHLHLWLTGTYKRDKAVPQGNGGLTFEGFPVKPEHGKPGVVEVDVDFGLPPGGFMTPETHDAIVARLKEQSQKVEHRADGCHLFTHLPPYDVPADSTRPDRQRRLCGTVEGYVLWERLASAGIRDGGRRRGWNPREGTALLNVRRLDLETAVAEAVTKAVIDVAEQRVDIEVVSTATTDRRAARLATADGLMQKAFEVRADAQDTDGAARDARKRDDAKTFDRYSAQATEEYERADRLEQEAAEIRREVEQSAEPQAMFVSSDLSTVAAVAGALRGYANNRVPTEINQALMRAGLRTLRLHANKTNPASVRWELSLDLQLTDGGTAHIPVSGTVRNRRRDNPGDKTRLVHAAIAEEFLAAGASIEDICVGFGQDRSWVVSGLRGHLEHSGIHRPGLRSAIVDLPPEMVEARRALWSALTGQHLTGAGGPALVERLATTYKSDASHPHAYVATDCSLARAVLHVVLEAARNPGNDGARIADIARAVGATRSEVNALVTPHRKAGSNPAKPRLLARNPLNSDIAQLRPCPHSDCPAPPGQRWASFYLPVPETASHGGMLCPDCRRLPDLALATLYFPESYFDPLWDGRFDPMTNSLAEHAVTHATNVSRYEQRVGVLRGKRLYNLAEAADRLDITDTALRNWTKADVDPIRATRVNGVGGLKLVIAEEELERVEGSPRHVQLQSTAPRAKRLDDGDIITLAELSTKVNVSEDVLRRRAKSGELGTVEYQSTLAAGRAPIVLSRKDVLNEEDPLAGTPLLPAAWLRANRIGLVLIGEACKRAGVSPFVLREACDFGELVCETTDGGTRRFDLVEIERWADARGRASITPKEAAAYLGVSGDVLRAAVARGELAAVKTHGGHRRYAVSDLDAYLHRRS